MTMPDTCVAGPDWATESGNFAYGALLRPMLRARTVSGAIRGFLWDSGTPSHI